MSDLKLSSAVVAVHEALKRIPPGMKGPFFTYNVRWFFVAVPGHCDLCAPYNGSIILGSELRTMFPWMQILDNDTIALRLHPNCRCSAHRISEFGENHGQ